MQKIRPPWRRARTPTPAEMRASTPSRGILHPASASLEAVGVGVKSGHSTGSFSGCIAVRASKATSGRSTSMDSDQVLVLEEKRPLRSSGSSKDSNDSNENRSGRSFLRVPLLSRRRSRSFDFLEDAAIEKPVRRDRREYPVHPHSLGSSEDHSAGPPLFGMLRRSFSRHSSTSDRGSSHCVHCLCVEEYERQGAGGKANGGLNGTSGSHAGTLEDVFFSIWDSDSDSCSSQGKEDETKANEEEEEDFEEEVESLVEPDDGYDLDDEEDEDEEDEEDNEGECGFPRATNSQSRNKNALSTTGMKRSPSATLSQLGKSMECQQKVKPWVEQLQGGGLPGLSPSHRLTPDASALTTNLRRGRSIGCDQEFRRAEAAATAQTYVPVLRRGGSEQTAPAPLPGLSLDLTDSSTCWSTKCQISVTISPNSSSVSRAPSFVSLSPQGSSPQGVGLGQEQSPAGPSSGIASPGANRLSRRSPTSAGTPRLERQEALTCWFDSEEQSLDLLAPPSPNDQGLVAGCCRRHISMETHPGSVETQGSFSLDQTELSFEVLPQQTSLESQTSVSMDVMVPESIRDASFDSQTSAESMGSSSVGRTHLGGSSSLRFRRWMKGRRCLSAGASPSTSPPHTTPLQLNRNSSLVVANPYFLPAVTSSGNSYGSVAHYATQHAMVCLLGSSSEYGEGEFADAIDVPPSPPAEIYLQVPVLPEIAPAAGRTANTRLSPVPVAGEGISPTCGMGVKHESALQHRERERDRSASIDASFVTLPATAAVATATRPRAAAVKGVEMSFNTTLSHEPNRKGLGCSQVVISDPQSLQQKQQAQLLRSRRHRLQRQHDASRSHDPTSSSSTTSSGPRATSSSRGSPIRPVVKKSGPVKVEEHRSSSSSSTGVEGSVGRLHLRPEKPCRSRSMEMNLSVTASSSAVATAVAAAAVVAADCEYRTLGGHARRQQWVSRLKKSGPGEVIIQNENGERRVLRSTPDWSEEAVNGDHLWVPTSASGDLCYVSDNECSKTGARMKCSACRIVAHVSCIPLVMDKMKLCRFTFWDGDLRQYREHTATLHHWVHRRSQTGKCKQCSKSFQSKLSFSNKEVIAIHCSWCKAAFHNKDTCFSMPRLSEHCSLGVNADIIVPPSWIVKLPGKDNFKSSLRKSPRKKTATRKKAKDKEKEYRAFVVKSIPSTTLKPVLVFINPKSGGNQGAKLMQKFQWLLNPRQVFDLTQGGPKAGLEMFKKVPNLRILACGGDGTAGWVLSVLDQIGISPPPAVGVLPLGTGNDLARALGWGGGYTDEPISKILRNVAEAETVYLDRWKLEVEKNADAQPTEEGKDSLPLNVMNNYFSFGVDAQIALEFHEAREARPQKFNSRLKNKMFYGQAGGKDLLQRKWKDLSEFVTLECDGKDITSKLREQKVHAILFLNIASYAGGTHPWNRAVAEQATDDGVIEVVGLTTYQLPLLQAGGHGTSLARCKIARIVTSKTIPMQVDGEACRLNPSHISISLLNRAPVLAKRRGGKSSNTARVVEQLTVTIRKICMADYEQFHYDKEQLQAASVVLGTITVSHDAVLEQVRKLIQPLLDTALGGHTTSPGPGSSSPTNGSEEKLPLDWCFIDSCTAERFFRVDSGQEHLHYISDITTDELYVLVDSGTHSCHITDSTLTDGHPSADTLTLMSGTQDLETEDSLDAAHVKLPLLDSVSGDGSQDTGLEDMLDLVRQEEEILANGDETRKVRIGNEGPQGKVLKPRLSLKNMAVGVTFAISTPEENSTPDTTGQEERRQGKVGAGGKILKARLSLKNLALGVGVAHISRGTANDETHDESTPVEEPAGSPLQHVRVGVALPGLCKISPKEQFMSTSYSRRSPLLEKPSENILKAAKTGDLKKLKDLHNSGFSLLSIDSSGSTALHLSAKNGHRDVVRYLLTATGTSARALLDMMDNDSGQTALHKAAYNRRRTIVCLLVTAGANLLLKDKEGRTPRELAIKAEDFELAEYLESQEKFQRDYSEDVTTAV